jgi:hypothetical protein
MLRLARNGKSQALGRPVVRQKTPEQSG